MLYGRRQLLLLSQTDPNNFFQKVLLIHFISTYANLLQHLNFAHFLLIKGYGKCVLRREPLLVVAQNSYSSKVLMINSIST